ncbi:MAG TPA: alpha/beta fold hydrolase, partial [Thauera aminoaromatica]|nr:alpha/beta fold hydrolase [Thauera aminoaromatica]HNF76955.1 alpha/beta fold hydrolase [Thauera aminoaromatica]
MSDTTGKQVPPGMQAILAAGQAMAQGFFDALARQHVAMQDSSGVAAQKLPMPETEVMASLQKVFAEKHAELWSSMLARTPGAAGPAVVQPEPGDKRFAAPEWSESPVFDYMRQAYLLNAGFLRQMADAMPIADGRAKARMQFLTRQYIDALSPSNFAATNPEFIKTAVETKGESIARGIQNLLGDLEKGRISMTDDAAFEIGRNLALTPGSVVYENELMQLIQYAPLTEKVAQTPLLIVPPCINKFYIMDLQPENSLVRFVVEQGFTVFLVSWKNPRPDTGGHYTWDDYLDKGPLAALEVVRSITRVKKPNVLGFCVGGTILTSALAVARARGEEPVASLTLMTTLLDFSDAGELGCLVDEASVTAREAAIGKGGVLKGQELANVFSFLRANDLVWQYVVGNYLKGNKPVAFDLLYWNSDSTNLPGPFLTWYLRNMYLENNLRVPGKL